MEGETRRQDLLKQLLESAESDAANEELLDKLVAQNLSVDLSQDDDFETRGQKAADAVAKFAGSWAFIVSFILVLIGWMCINLLLASGAFDPFPFILLNL
ncbi:PF06210 domain protein, partial [Shuttleworthella sp. MSX8B]